MANEQTKAGDQGGATQGQSGSGTGGFERTNLPGGRTSFTVPASVGQVLEPKRLMWYGGLAALGLVGLVEWPVVAVVGAATYVSQRFARDDIQSSQH